MKHFADTLQTLNRRVTPLLLLVSCGFIFSMHWFLLMADTKVSGIPSDIVPAEIIATIIGYYTVIFGPMTWLIKIFILLMLLTMTLQLFIREIAWYLRWIIFLTNAPLVFYGVLRIIPLVDHLILNTDTPEVQSQIVRTVHTAHVLSAWAVALMIALQLVVILRLQKNTD